MEFPDREPLTLCLASGSGEQPLSDLALAYWFYEKGKTPWIADTRRGSMAVFHQLFAAHVSQTGSEKQRPAAAAVFLAADSA